MVDERPQCFRECRMKVAGLERVGFTGRIQREFVVVVVGYLTSQYLRDGYARQLYLLPH